MPSELVFLGLTAILNAVLWVPVVAGYLTTRGFLKRADYVTAPEGSLPDWVNRANRAHMNAVENLSPFAAIVLIAHVSGYSNDTTKLLAAVFFFARLGHAIVHISGFNILMARTVIFGVGNVATIVLGAMVVGNLL